MVTLITLSMSSQHCIKLSTTGESRNRINFTHKIFGQTCVLRRHGKHVTLAQIDIKIPEMYSR